MLLALDTSGPFCSTALFDNGKIVASRSENLGRGHAERLMPMLEEILAQANAGWPDLKRIGCVTGPGSFTGLRVGLATARGLSMALKIPCTGITVFEAFAHKYGQDEALCVVMDAKRNQVWIQNFPDKKAATTASASGIESALDTIDPDTKRLAGSGASLVGQYGGRFEIVSHAPSPPIESVAHLAALQTAAMVPPKPLYLRAPDAKPQNTSAPVT